jgi:uncharacterized membrane protein YccC
MAYPTLKILNHQREWVLLERPDSNAVSKVALSVISALTALIGTILIVRLLAMAVGLAADNTIGNIVYTLSKPLTAGFFALIGYTPTYGVSQFEPESFVVLIAYVCAAILLMSLFWSRRQKYAE